MRRHHGNRAYVMLLGAACAGAAGAWGCDDPGPSAPDAAPVDASAPDASPADASLPDPSADASPADASPSDASPPDASPPDASPPDADPGTPRISSVATIGGSTQIRQRGQETLVIQGIHLAGITSLSLGITTMTNVSITDTEIRGDVWLLDPNYPPGPLALAMTDGENTFVHDAAMEVTPFVVGAGAALGPMPLT